MQCAERSFDNFRELALEQRLETCLAVLRAIAAHRHAAVEHLVPRILDSASGDPDRDQWRTCWKDRVPPELWEADEAVRSACITIVIGFTREPSRLSEAERDDRMMWAMIRLLEEAADAGMDVSGF